MHKLEDRDSNSGKMEIIPDACTLCKVELAERGVIARYEEN